ncbi:hypothetical protein FRC12_002130 [Ceratobasidium sp. 428]|nr:hypothetical protein FRC12_002130 [Ceratobasidium sp. 428]
MFEQLSSPRALFRNLTTAVVHLYKFERRSLPNDPELLSGGVARVFDQSSLHLIRLAVKPLVTDRGIVLSLPLLRAYSHTSLKYLELDTIRMVFDGTSQNVQQAVEWGQLLTVMPHLEELKLRDQEISLQELCAITTILLRLRLLLLKAVLLNEELAMPDLAGKPTVAEPITIQCWFQGGQRRWETEFVLGLARCIHLFRPNAKFQAHRNTALGDAGKVWFTKELASAMVYVRLGLELPPMHIPSGYGPMKTDMIKAYNRTPLTCYLRLRERMARDNRRM